jgi:hypothetical protein
VTAFPEFVLFVAHLSVGGPCADERRKPKSLHRIVGARFVYRFNGSGAADFPNATNCECGLFLFDTDLFSDDDAMICVQR